MVVANYGGEKRVFLIDQFLAGAEYHRKGHLTLLVDNGKVVQESSVGIDGFGPLFDQFQLMWIPSLESTFLIISATACASLTGTPFPMVLNLCERGISGGRQYQSGTVWIRIASRTVSLRGSMGWRWTSLLP